MKLDSKEKLIWEMSQKVELPPIPNKDIIWERLIQEIEMHQDKSEDFIPEKGVILDILDRHIAKKKTAISLWTYHFNVIPISI